MKPVLLTWSFTEKYHEPSVSCLSAAVFLCFVFGLSSCLLCVWEHASSSAFVTLSSRPPWVGCDPVSLQLPQVTNSHPGALVIQGMYFSTLYALCPFLKFSKNLTGHRSSYQTEAVDKNSNWYTGHLKILAPVHSHLEDTLFCWPYFENFWHFVLMSPGTGVRGRFCSQKRGLHDVDVFLLACNLILLRKCQSAGERVCGHQILRDLKGPLCTDE